MWDISLWIKDWELTAGTVTSTTFLTSLHTSNTPSAILHPLPKEGNYVWFCRACALSVNIILWYILCVSCLSDSLSLLISVLANKFSTCWANSVALYYLYLVRLQFSLYAHCQQGLAQVAPITLSQFVVILNYLRVSLTKLHCRPWNWYSWQMLNLRFKLYLM